MHHIYYYYSIQFTFKFTFICIALF